MSSEVNDQVDYFQHDFNALDLHSTWKVATKDKDKVNNGRRLENASWRRFFQELFHLSKIPAIKIGIEREGNWLVGPFHSHEFQGLKELEAAAKAAAAANLANNSVRPHSTAGALLKRNKQNHHSLSKLAHS